MSNHHPDFGIHSSRILTEAGFIRGTILIKDGVILKIVPGKIEAADYPIEDSGECVVMPGIIDSHVHVNEPGRTEWEGFETITRAAIAGGITTLVDMPLNASPVTTTAESLQLKINSAKDKIYCHCGFWGGLVPDNLSSLNDLCDSGILGVKAFLTHSGIDDFPHVNLAELKQGLTILKKHNLPLLAHAELDEFHEGIPAFEKNPTNYLAYLASRPKSWEDRAIAMLIDLCETIQTAVHIVHLSSSDSIEQIKIAKMKGLALTVETCPQYLFFCAEEIPNGDTRFKCAPPIREKENREKLWAALKDGTIDFIVTDHSPATPDLKEIESGNLQKAWGGISSIQFSLPVIWTSAQRRGFQIADVSRWMSSSVADFIGFKQSKGYLKEGYDADIVIWNPEEKFTVKTKDIHFRHRITPYEGQELLGVVKQTYVSGKKVFDHGTIGLPPSGSILLRQQED